MTHKTNKQDMAIAERARLRQEVADQKRHIASLLSEIAAIDKERGRLTKSNSELVNLLNTARFELARERGEYDPERSTSPFIRRNAP